MPNRITVCFTKEDLALFSAASHDRNPLHVSDKYARSTPYGRPVVFGVLGALAALGHLPNRTDLSLGRVALEFRNPMTVGVSYRIEVSETNTCQSLAKIYDAERLMMKATFTFLPAQPCTASRHISEHSLAMEPADLNKDDFRVGSQVTGTYGPSTSEFNRLVARWRLSGKGATPLQIVAMMWASFAVGMELPGKRAIFWRLLLDFKPDDGHDNGPFSYSVFVKDFDERVDLLHTTGELSCAYHLFAAAEMWAFVRRDSPLSSISEIKSLLAPSEQLKGKVALVIGGSRGLGAAISQALALQGCSVLLNYYQCKAEAEQVRASVEDISDRIELVQGDATDIQWCEELRRHILAEYKNLDLLVCNASPSIGSISFMPANLVRFQEFISQSIALVSVPMSAFLGLLSERSGWNIVISSAVVSSTLLRDIPAEWPHYVTAKFAVEGLAHWAAMHHPRTHHLVVRPAKLWTDQTNTPMGRQGAMAVEQAAIAIVKHVGNSAPSKSVEVLEIF
jgi:NAD(P)-dependent dehydrogenase (short-subunit alcohol dehydrogenase family)